jgi:hypothetical protein
MAEEALAIGRLATQFRLRPGVRVGRLRLEGLVRDATSGALESALGRAGVSTDEDICIRRVEARMALDLARTDATLALNWSTTVARAIRAAIDRGGDAVVRYPTRRMALIDLVVAVARGELRRAWAWRQIGLWPAREVAAGPDAGAEAARVLAAHPRLVVPVLREVARLGALPSLVAQVVPAALAALAEAALSGATRSVATGGAADEAEPAAWLPAAVRLARRSVVARAAAVALARVQAEPAARVVTVRRALAVLALLDAEPGAGARGATARAGLLAALEAIMVSEAGAPDGSPTATTSRRPGDAAPPAAAARPSVDRTGPVEPARASVADSAAAHESAPDSALATDPALAPGSPSTGIGEAAREPAAATAADAPAGAPLDRRDRGTTRAAGLLFLIHVVRELDLPGALLELAPLRARPLPWTLHRLALALRPLPADDPAALAFAGLGPHAPVPDNDEPPSDAETHAIAGAADRVVERLRTRLARQEAPREALLDEVCARRGEILADPGWIEVRLELDDVSIELRRAGLDLDPDWVPWLGVVVRFVYA